MAYYLRCTPHTRTLVERTRAEALVETIEPAKLGDTFRHFEPVDASYARHWVKRDGHHETALWVDNGKVRYARDSN